eukprot:TRINITY_DN71277_c0_g1_i1.p1 TRINITY_DN71277_c0_g1~~TRINITY_DN71277_c0_g1_i1.p1  ORF type:complete len:238 (+),score=22.05 TRINITY_DN71277_c0_g1_i1:98-811(+)
MCAHGGCPRTIGLILYDFIPLESQCLFYDVNHVDHSQRWKAVRVLHSIGLSAASVLQRCVDKSVCSSDYWNVAHMLSKVHIPVSEAFILQVARALSHEQFQVRRAVCAVLEFRSTDVAVAIPQLVATATRADEQLGTDYVCDEDDSEVFRYSSSREMAVGILARLPEHALLPVVQALGSALRSGDASQEAVLVVLDRMKVPKRWREKHAFDEPVREELSRIFSYEEEQQYYDMFSHE